MDKKGILYYNHNKEPEASNNVDHDFPLLYELNSSAGLLGKWRRCPTQDALHQDDHV